MLSLENGSVAAALAAGASAAIVGCGGLVVLERDDGGTGGAGTTSTSGTSSTVVTTPAPPNATSTASSVTTGPDCDALRAELELAIDRARACSPLDPVIQCDGSAILFDTCGCPGVVANEHNALEIQQAVQAYEAWISSGCGPDDCEQCIPAGPGWCQAEGDGSKGRCIFATF